MKKPTGSKPMANLSGKYATCTNKNETLNFQQTVRLVTNRFNDVVKSPTEVAAAPIESARDILLKKGSKCKCAVGRVGHDQNRFGGDYMMYGGQTNRPDPCGKFCKHLSGHMQKKIVKKLLL